jgi:hypothetical protein
MSLEPETTGQSVRTALENEGYAASTHLPSLPGYTHGESHYEQLFEMIDREADNSDSLEVCTRCGT